MLRSWDVEQKRREFSEFYALAKDDCLRIVLVSVGDRQLAEDLVAEAFTRAWMSWRKVREHPVPRAWVVRTALNVNVSWWRRRREVVVDQVHQLSPAIAAQYGQYGQYAQPAQGSWSTSVDDALVTAIRALPLRQREVITLRVFFDLDTVATGKLLGISPSTVGVHLHRALATLRAQIPSFTDQEETR